VHTTLPTTRRHSQTRTTKLRVVRMKTSTTKANMRVRRKRPPTRKKVTGPRRRPTRINIRTISEQNVNEWETSLVETAKLSQN
jgi:hypothetical protein